MLDEIMKAKSRQTEKKFQELLLKMQRLTKSYEDSLQELETTPEEIKTFASNPENFSPSEWEALQRETQEADERLEKELANLRDESQIKQKLRDRGSIQQHWLFVR